MTRITINGRFLTHKSVTGVQRYAYELLKALDPLLSELRSEPVEVLAPHGAQALPDLHNFRLRRVGKYDGHIWEQFELPEYCRGTVLFTPSGGAPVRHPCNVITIHDAAVFAAPQAYSLQYRLWYRWLQKRLCRTALHILTVSEFSKDELVRWCGADSDRITVTHLGADHVHNGTGDSSVLERHGLRKGEYVLAVSSMNPNKNFQGVVKAAEVLGNRNVQFALAGGTDPKVFSRNWPIPPSVKQLSYVSDRELTVLYRNSGCFVFPSFYEGFGLPPLEAAASGCPVVVSRAASLPEVFGDAALYCDPRDPRDIAEKIVFALESASALIPALQRRAAEFRWRKCAELTWLELSRIAAL